MDFRFIDLLNNASDEFQAWFRIAEKDELKMSLLGRLDVFDYFDVNLHARASLEAAALQRYPLCGFLTPKATIPSRYSSGTASARHQLRYLASLSRTCG